MSAMPFKPAGEVLRTCGVDSDQFIVSHGKSGIVGVFVAPEPLPLKRGERVIVRTNRGIEIGAVLGPASLRQARLIGATSAGELLRLANDDDETCRIEITSLEQQIFHAGRACAAQFSLAMEILDVDVLFDRAQAIVQFVGNDTATEKLAATLEQQFGVTVRLENLAVPAAHDEPEEHGCGKPDCGKGEGGCTDCSTGGCSSCGSSKVDLRPYFGHLRDQMEANKRVPLAST